MTLLTAKMLARVAFWAVAVLVVWGELRPGDIGFNAWDKLQHLEAYALMAGLATAGLGVLAGLITFGIALEILQGMVGRDMGFKDEIANTLGVIMGGSADWALGALLRAWVVEIPAGD